MNTPIELYIRLGLEVRIPGYLVRVRILGLRVRVWGYWVRVMARISVTVFVSGSLIRDSPYRETLHRQMAVQ